MPVRIKKFRFPGNRPHVRTQERTAPTTAAFTRSTILCDRQSNLGGEKGRLWLTGRFEISRQNACANNQD